MSLKKLHYILQLDTNEIYLKYFVEKTYRAIPTQIVNWLILYFRNYMQLH